MAKTKQVKNVKRAKTAKKTMPAALAAQDGDVWVPKDKAAEILGLSVRRLQEYCQRGLIQRRFLQQGTTRVSVMREADVLALRRSLDAGRVMTARASGAFGSLALAAPTEGALVPVPAPINAPGETALLGRMVQSIQELAAKFEAPPPAVVVEAPRPWLTLAEAAAYSGLPSKHLLAAILNGELPARDVGRRRGGKWRVRRIDLDAISGKAEGENHAG